MAPKEDSKLGETPSFVGSMFNLGRVYAIWLQEDIPLKKKIQVERDSFFKEISFWIEILQTRNKAVWWYQKNTCIVFADYIHIILYIYIFKCKKHIWLEVGRKSCFLHPVNLLLSSDHVTNRPLRFVRLFPGSSQKQLPYYWKVAQWVFVSPAANGAKEAFLQGLSSKQDIWHKPTKPRL